MTTAVKTPKTPMTKAAEAQLVRNLAVEWGEHNIRANAIAPGLIRTDFARALWEDPDNLKRVERVLQGKHKPTYTPHVDDGDFVVVTNAEKVRVTGKKAWNKVYPYYTGWTGGLKSKTYGEIMEQDPAQIVRLAVKRMLPKSKLGRQMLTKLKVYAGGEHPHAAQKPQPLDPSKI